MFRYSKTKHFLYVCNITKIQLGDAGGIGKPLPPNTTIQALLLLSPKSQVMKNDRSYKHEDRHENHKEDTSVIDINGTDKPSSNEEFSENPHINVVLPSIWIIPYKVSYGMVKLPNKKEIKTQIGAFDEKVYR